MRHLSLSPTTNSERRLAALAHAAVLLPGWGLLVPTALWAAHPRRGDYLSFQSLQALTYQVAQLIVLAVLGVGLGGLYAGGAILLSLLSAFVSQDVSSGLFVLANIFFFGSLAAAWGLLTLGGVIAAILCLSGQDVRYPLLGERLERALLTEATSEIAPTLHPEREARWMAALTYAGVLINLYGWLIPLIVWLTQKERSALLRFQALQSFVYQAIGNLVLFFLNLMLAATVFPLIFLLALVESTAAHWVPFFLVPYGLLVLGTLAFSLLYTVVGLWAGLRLAQGHEVTLPGLGHWLRRRLHIPASASGGLHA
ncbi:DUF4870 domain-containing protein [uncultured Thermanaerothrix sp.]|uniref:DUF4870 domain-containing protein n=1 Tax=uncultured Thermanaerothrix sp. TaxID=1195149 RepID=UPI0026240B70|nr:DUF4870 domain-containing protein [uncultured Thermanaerothrix sp.]